MSSFLTRFHISINTWVFWLLLSISNLKFARQMFTLVTKPKSWQKSWMKLDPQEKTILWVAEGVASQKQEELYDRVRNADVVLFWSHGGAIILGSASQNVNVFVGWIKLFKEKKNLDLVCCAIEYRLMPENPPPAQYEDVAAAYTHLIKNMNVDPKKIIMGGDSAGGLLNPDTIIYNNLYKDVSPSFVGDLPVPAGYVFSSPVTSTLDNCSSMKENAKKDYVASGLGWVEAFDNANPNLEPKPWAFLKEEKLGAQIPKRVLVFAGGHELKRDENILVAETFKKAGADTTLVQENYAHNWFLLADYIVDETDVIERALSTYFDWIVQTLQQA